MKLLCMDTETTGLDNDCNILTAYFVLMNVDPDGNLSEIDNLDLKIKYPYYKVYPRALEINNINLIKHHNDFNSVYLIDAKDKIEAFLKKHFIKNRFVPLGHNVLFDLNMLKNNKILTHDLVKKYLSPNCLDTVTIAQYLKTCGIIKETDSLSLQNLCKIFNINNTSNLQLHNAECDIRMTIQLYTKFIKILRMTDKYVNEKYEENDYEEIYRNTKKRKYGH